MSETPVTDSLKTKAVNRIADLIDLHKEDNPMASILWQYARELDAVATRMERDRTRLLGMLRHAAVTLDQAGRTWDAECIYNFCDELENEQ